MLSDGAAAVIVPGVPLRAPPATAAAAAAGNGGGSPHHSQPGASFYAGAVLPSHSSSSSWAGEVDEAPSRLVGLPGGAVLGNYCNLDRV